MCIGSALAFYMNKTNEKLLSAALGFSAGVMIYVSMIDIFVKVREFLEMFYGSSKGYQYVTIDFSIGILLVGVIDKFVPENENSHEIHNVEEIFISEQDKMNF